VKKERALKTQYDALREKKLHKRLLKDQKKLGTPAARLETKNKVMSMPVGLTNKAAEKDTGFKRPAKLQRKLDEIKDSQPDEHNVHGSKRRKVEKEGRPKNRREERPPELIHKGGGDTLEPHESQQHTRSIGEQEGASADRDFYPATVFVGNLEEGITEQVLEPLFTRFGQIECIRLISGKNFGFIKYVTREAASAAIAGMNGELVGQQHVRVSRAKVPSTRGGWGRRRHWDSHSQAREEGEGFARSNEREQENFTGTSPGPNTERGLPADDAVSRERTERTITVYDDL